MGKSTYRELREFAEHQPLIDCHDHSVQCGPPPGDPVKTILGHYFLSDLISASSEERAERVADASLSLDERWPLLKEAWDRTCHTGYARVTRLVMREFYGEEKLTLEALKRMENSQPDYTDPALFEGVLGKAGIVCRIQDVWPDPGKVVDRSLELTPRSRLAVSLPDFHNITCYGDVERIGKILHRNVTSLDEYLQVCWEIFTAYRDYGAVAFKDQSAYRRPIDYANPSRARGEEIFNRLMEDPRRVEPFPANRDLDDFLFHEFLRMIRDLDLPLQLHTGHMAGIRNDVVKADASGLRRVIELHRDVRFDLFHGNWPNEGPYLFLAKNYPNVALNLCWTNIVDPVYARDLYKRIIASVPHGKVHGYGSDFTGFPERAWAHAHIARDNMCLALADMVDEDYLGPDEARDVLRAWMFDNPNRFFKLGLAR